MMKSGPDKGTTTGAQPQMRRQRSVSVCMGSRCGEALLVGEGGASLLTRQEVVMAPL